MRTVFVLTGLYLVLRFTGPNPLLSDWQTGPDGTTLNYTTVVRASTRAAWRNMEERRDDL